MVERAGGGYRLGLGDSDVDAMELSRLVGEARAAAAAGDLDLARVCAEAALAITVGGAGDEVTRDLVAEANGQVVVCGHAEERGSGRFQGSFTGGPRGFTAPVVVAIRWSSSERQRASSRPREAGIRLNHGP